MTDDTQKPDTSDPSAENKPAVEGDSLEIKSNKTTKSHRAKPARKSRVKERKGVGFMTAVVMMLLAAFGGAVLSQLYELYSPTHEQGISAAQVQALEGEIEAKLEAKLKVLPKPQDMDLGPLTARVEALEANLTALPGSEGSSLDPESRSVARVPVDVETRLAALEANLAPDVSALETRLTALETVPREPQDADSVPSETLLARIDDLEKASDISSLDERLRSLETTTETLSKTMSETPPQIAPELLERLQALENSVQTLPKPVDLSSVEARIASLEAEAQSLKSTQADVIKATAPIPPFPSEVVLNALENTETKSDKGWFGKTFDKYVLADNAEAIKTVSRVELLLQQGRVDMALEQVQGLPEPAQVAAKDWIDAVNARRR